MARQYGNSRLIYCARLGNKHISIANDEEGAANAVKMQKQLELVLVDAQILIQPSCIKDSTLTLLQSTIE